MITIKNVNKVFCGKNIEVTALKNVSIEIEKGDIYGVIGFSGAGKSTLIRMVNQLEKPDSGEVIVDGFDISKLKERELSNLRKNIGMVFQQFNLLESKTVFENIAIPLKLAGWKKKEINKRVEELLEFVELSEKKNEYIGKLSGGQKQRVGISRALATKPDILLCDEATSALDPKTTEAILALLKKINKEMGITIFLITHEMNVIQKICNKVAVMEFGEIIEKGNTVEIFSNPKNKITKEFVQSVFSEKIPESIMTIVKNDKRNGQIEKLNFVGETVNHPIISRLSKIEGIEMNILCANVKEIQETVICLFVIHLIGNDENIRFAENMIDQAGVVRERVVI
ncbi:MAG: methionine ABC transporter ATP-binding protein [Lachnospiraceae bacterium]